MKKRKWGPVAGEGFFVKLEEDVQGAGGRATSGFGQSAGAGPDPAGAVGVVEQIGGGRGEVSGAGDCDTGFVSAEVGGDLREVFHVGAKEERPAEKGRLEDVVAATVGERAAHEHHGVQGEQGSEFADGIEEQHAGEAVETGAGGKGGAAHEGDSSVGEFLGDDFETFGLAGGEDQQQTGEARGEFGEGAEDSVVFVDVVGKGWGHGAGGDEDVLRGSGVQEGADVRRDGAGFLEVVLEVAGGDDAVWGRAKLEEAVAGGGVLGQDAVRQGEDRPEEAAEAKVAGEGGIGDAAVDEQQAAAGAFGFAEEVGPDFGFGDDDEGGTDGAQDAANGEAEVEGGVEDAGGKSGQPGFGEGASGQGGGGDKERDVREGGAQAADQREDGEDLADGDGVEPNGAGKGLVEGVGQET